ncbi:MAG: NUDIX domain-containing protein [Clostridia bacterium]|nr:NUDIX domain-containing protein [Clostridia bacterium]
MNDYIESMRSMIGHKPMFLVGSGVIVRDGGNRILLIKRTDNDTWGIPGGSLELGETFEEAAEREVLEETGLAVGKLRMMKLFSGKEMRHIYPNGDEVYNVACIFVSDAYEGTINADGIESSNAGFFSMDSLPADINPPDRIILREYRLLCRQEK